MENGQKNGDKVTSPAQGAQGGVIIEAKSGPEAALPKPTEATLGEKRTSTFTYFTLQYAANVIGSALLANYMINGGGKPLLNKIKGGISSLLKSCGIAAKSAESTANVAGNIAMLPMGGHFIAAATYPIEQNWDEVVHWVNKVGTPGYKYANSDVAPPTFDPPTKQEPKHIAIRRLMGWGTVTATGVLIGEKNNKLLEDTIYGSVEKLGLNSGIKPIENLFRKPTTGNLGRLIALDAIYTIITAWMTKATNKMFGKKEENKAAPVPQAANPEVPPAPLPETPQPDLYVSADTPSPIVNIEKGVEAPKTTTKLEKHDNFEQYAKQDVGSTSMYLPA